MLLYAMLVSILEATDDEKVPHGCKLIYAMEDKTRNSQSRDFCEQTGCDLISRNEDACENKVNY